MKAILIIFTLLAPLFCYAQTGLSGVVKTKITNQPIEDCHVFINENLGTITNANGEFQLQIPNKFAGSNLHVTHAAFKTFSKPANEIGQNAAIVLEPSIIMLDEIVVRPDPWVVLQESIKKILSNTKELTDDKIYFAILQELEKTKPETNRIPLTNKVLNQK